MQRFLKYTTELKRAQEKCDQKLRQQGLPYDSLAMSPAKKQTDVLQDFKISFSPKAQTRNRQQFVIKPTTVNNFTGEPLEPKHEIKLDRTSSESGLYVQIGNQTNVFRYGEKPEQKPTLIQSYITLIK